MSVSALLCSPHEEMSTKPREEKPALREGQAAVEGSRDEEEGFSSVIGK